MLAEEKHEGGFRALTASNHGCQNSEDEDDEKQGIMLITLLSKFLEKRDERSEFCQRDYQNSLKTLTRLIRSVNLRRVALYFIHQGAATDLILQQRLRISGASVRWARRELAVLGVIETALPLRAERGRRAVVWMIPDASPPQIRDAAILHTRLKSPKYRVAEEVAQTILDNYLSKKTSLEITYREIVLQIKHLSLPFSTPDIADLAAQVLHEKGVRIWR